mgnify:CR=1 FL=1
MRVCKRALSRFVRRALVMGCCAGVSVLAAAEEPAGLVKVASGAVRIERAGTELPVTPGTPVEAADVVITGADGRCGITFRDNSLLSLGPDSRLVVERFQFDSTTHEGGFDSLLQQGRLAVVSGKLAKHGKDQMKVRTPSSILGVRGTEFVVEAAARP